MVLKLIFGIILFFDQTAFAFYEVADENRPPSAFSLCCCKKQTEEVNQVVYKCRYEELEKCPEGVKHYKVASLGCPSDLILTKLLQTAN